MKLLVSLIAMAFISNTYAAMAVGYTCVGKNLVDNSAVAFSVSFSDSDPEVGYSNQSITITKTNGMELDKPVILQMFGANKKNECKKYSEGEFYLNGDNNFKMDSQDKNELSNFIVSFKSSCAKEARYDVKGYCFFE